MKKINSIVCLAVCALCINFYPTEAHAQNFFDIIQRISDKVENKYGYFYSSFMALEGCGYGDMLSVSNDQVLEFIDDELAKYKIDDTDKAIARTVIILQYLSFQNGVKAQFKTMKTMFENSDLNMCQFIGELGLDQLNKMAQ